MVLLNCLTPTQVFIPQPLITQTPHWTIDLFDHPSLKTIQSVLEKKPSTLLVPPSSITWTLITE